MNGVFSWIFACLAKAIKIVVLSCLKQPCEHVFWIADYAGTGASTAPNAALASYNYEYTAGTQVASIAIAGIPVLAPPVMGNGRVTITYAGQTATALGAPVLLTPGSGTVTNSALPSNPMRSAEPIVWGCGIASVAAFKYVPANCRYLVP